MIKITVGRWQLSTDRRVSWIIWHLQLKMCDACVHVALTNFVQRLESCLHVRLKSFWRMHVEGFLIHPPNTWLCWPFNKISNRLDDTSHKENTMINCIDCTDIKKKKKRRIWSNFQHLWPKHQCEQERSTLKYDCIFMILQRQYRFLCR